MSSQFNRPVRSQGFTQNFVNRKQMDAAKKIKNGKYTGGTVELLNVNVTIDEIFNKIVEHAKASGLDVEIPADKVESRRNSVAKCLLGDLNFTRASSMIVKNGDVELSGVEWFATLPEKQQKFENFAKLLKAAVAKGLTIEHEGINIQIPACLIQTGKQGRQAAKLSDYVADL